MIEIGTATSDLQFKISIHMKPHVTSESSEHMAGQTLKPLAKVHKLTDTGKLSLTNTYTTLFTLRSR